MHVARLVKKAKKGNKKALLQLIMTEKDAYYRLAYTYMGNEHDAMDALGEMIVIVYEKIANLKNADVFYTWSKTILVNCCKSMLSKQKKLIFMEEWYSHAGKEQQVNDSDLKLELEDLLAVLSEEQKETIILKYLHDLDLKTIAELTETSIGTVKSRIHYGLKKLKSTDRRIENGQH